MRILITGGAGFIGSHMVDRLIAEGHQVVAMDNLVTGDLANIAHHRSNPNFEFIHHDISNHIHVAGPLDWVLNFASPASPIDYMEFPIQTLKVGALGTHNALGLAKAKGAKFFLTSTSEVYGDPLVHPQHEEYWGNVNPIGPRSCYDEAKRFAEAITYAYHRAHGVDVRVVRIFNTYGPRNRVNDGRVVPTFINQALRGEALTVFGEGRQTRSFQYVDDLIEGIRRLMNSSFTKPVNIGNPTELTILEFAKLILALTGSNSEIIYKPLPQDDPKTRRPDNSRAKEVLGWEPRVAVEDGMKRTIDWYRSQM
ncbi:MAG TPA: SDR family oxidoreductase [Blastocatellia bacterium]|nr:SDR family oxidoreductase [Blastocatellia bacterium]HMV85231.1 SDR family oxidoreductase [Blastocatellia bacterium]HMY74596.1 SDR family oxidoreductase [Blastocatellia bacterium]HMZ19493.1 SDR family oxidoreductase [Blastocatellia bacterium]HNG28665.1 SDR family oxidoreductase [Blastocatellia bacterium]